MNFLQYALGGNVDTPELPKFVIKRCSKFYNVFEFFFTFRGLSDSCWLSLFTEARVTSFCKENRMYSGETILADKTFKPNNTISCQTWWWLHHAAGLIN